MDQRSFVATVGRAFAADVRDRGLELLEPIPNAYWERDLNSFMSELAPLIIDILEFS